MIEQLRKNPLGFLISIVIIMTIFLILSVIFDLIVPNTFQIGDMIFPAFQSIQLIIVFPLGLFLIYMVFIRTKYLSWKDLGFTKGKTKLRFTVLLGIIGGFFIGIYDYFNMNYFLLESNRILPNFFEKCISAPIWEEFFFRVLVLSMLEMIFLFFITIIFDHSKFKEKFTESNKKWITYEIYFLIIFLNALIFTLSHENFTLNIFFSGVIATIVYLKSRSIISPIIVHTMSNFVTGGFLFLILHYF